jgi:hypothetical protein
MARVFSFPALPVFVTRTTDEGDRVTVKPTKKPREGSLISCFYDGLWLVAYYYPIEGDGIRLMDESGDTRTFECGTLDIEGEVIERPRAALHASKRIHHSN